MNRKRLASTIAFVFGACVVVSFGAVAQTVSPTPVPTSAQSSVGSRSEGSVPTPASTETPQTPTATPKPALNSLSKIDTSEFVWRLTATGGLTLDSTADEAVNVNGTSVGATTLRSKGVPVIGIELTWQKSAASAFQFGALGEWNQFNTGSGGKPDTELALFLEPKVEKAFGPVRLWAGIGGGVVVLSTDAQSITDNGVLITPRDTSSVELGYSPRIGIDVFVVDGVSIGLQTAYHSYSTSLGFNLTDLSSGNTGLGTLNVGRSWFSSAVRLGVTL